MSTTPPKGRADFLDLGDWNAQCYQCGRKRKASEMKKYWQGYYVCPEHWEPRQPQDFVRSVPDRQVPPWVQPMPTDTFTDVGNMLTTDSGGTDTVPPTMLMTDTYHTLVTDEGTNT